MKALSPQAKRAIREGIFGVLSLLGRPFRDGGICILSYHSLDEHATPLSVAPGRFREQMEALARAGCVSFTMREVGERLLERRPFPPRAVAITFDDGFENMLTEGLPLLKKYRLKATLYAITGMIGRRTRWTDRGVPLPPLRILSWPQLEELHRQGVEMGAHTVTHGFLTSYPDDELDAELCEPLHELESRLGERPVSFAYPQGDYDARIVRAVRRAGYATAGTVDQGRARLSSDPLRLPRVLVSNNTSPRMLSALLTPAATPAYRLLNFAYRRVMGKRLWPRRAPGEVDSTGSDE